MNVKGIKLATRLYPDLSTIEITIWKAIWLFGIINSLCDVYIASQSKSAEDIFQDFSKQSYFSRVLEVHGQS